MPSGTAAPVDFDAGNERLRAAHLHNGQVEARALFAPFFAITAVAASLIVAWAMYGSVDHKLVIGWAALVTFANFVSCRHALEAASWGSSRTAKPRTKWFAVAEAVGLGALWSSLPTWAFATQPAHVQVVIGGAMVAMIGSAVGLAAIPAAALAWIGSLTGAFCAAYYLGSWMLGQKAAQHSPGMPSDTSWTDWLLHQAGPATLTGLVTITAALTLLGYFGTQFAWRWWIARKWRRRGESRKEMARKAFVLEDSGTTP